MTISRRQASVGTLSSTTSIADTFSSAPLESSLLVMVISTYNEISVSSISQTGVTWSSVNSRGSGSSGGTSTRVSVWVAWPDDVTASAVASFTVSLSGTTDVCIAFAEYTGLSGDISILSNLGTSAGLDSPLGIDPDELTYTDEQLFIVGGTKANKDNPFSDLTDGFTSVVQQGGGVTQYAALFEKIVSKRETARTYATFTGSSYWAASLVTFKVFPGDYCLDQELTGYSFQDQISVETLPVSVPTDPVTVFDQIEAELEIFREGSDALSVSDQLDLLRIYDRTGSDSAAATDDVIASIIGFIDVSDTISSVDQIGRELDIFREGDDSVAVSDQLGTLLIFDRIGSDTAVVTDQTERTAEIGAELSDVVSLSDQSSLVLASGIAGYPTNEPIRIHLESTVGISLSSVEVEVKFGFGSFQHVFENERFQVPAGSSSELTQLPNGWDLSIAPFGFWPQNTAITVRVSADSLSTPFTYSFSTADQAPEIRGVTFIQAAAGTT